MIDQLDMTLRQLLVDQIDALASPQQVRFEPPDAAWRALLANQSSDGSPVMSLNVCLVELRENRELRSTHRRLAAENGHASEERAPVRVDCHYLITAWDPAQAGASVEPTPDEHRLLYEALAVLELAAPVNPSRILPPGPLATVDQLIRRADLPTQIAPGEGFGKLPEFWGTMGPGAPWRPAIHLVVTLPVVRRRRVSGPLVTTTITDHRVSGRPGSAEILVQIGGRVLDAAGATVQRAAVRLEPAGGGPPLDASVSDADGRFRLGPMAPGRYRLAFGIPGLPEPPPRLVDVPSPSGEYDLRLA